jgi:iron complex transport system ATP-binding protein
MILEARGLTMHYAGAERPALDGVSCAVDAGELLAVVGPNGSGKTTLLRGLLGLVEVTSGLALVQDRSVDEWRRAELAQVIGVVTQREESVFPLRVAEAVMLGRYAKLGPLAAPRAADLAAVERAMARCDVGELSTRYVDTLSGGEWQRVRVARALAQEPAALVLDEPTSALDVRHEMEVLELVRMLVEGGLAGILVTHHLNLAARYADRILLLDHGRVVAEGTPGAVLTAETIEAVFGWPIAVTPWVDGSPQVTPLRPGEWDQ